MVPGTPRNKPHVLIVMLDQLRADSLGCAGHPVICTPAIDAMAAQGLRFTGVHTVSPVCQPARVSFVTGRYPHNHGIWHNRGELPVNYPTSFTALRGAGYATAAIGKSHLWSGRRVAHLRDGEPYLRALGFDTVDEIDGPRGTCATASGYSDYPRERGLFELFVSDTTERVADPTITRAAPFDEADHMDGYVGARAVRCVQAFPDDRPTCLFVNFPGPHDPGTRPAATPRCTTRAIHRRRFRSRAGLERSPTTPRRSSTSNPSRGSPLGRLPRSAPTTAAR